MPPACGGKSSYQNRHMFADSIKLRPLNFYQYWHMFTLFTLSSQGHAQHAAKAHRQGLPYEAHAVRMRAVSHEAARPPPFLCYVYHLSP